MFLEKRVLQYLRPWGSKTNEKFVLIGTGVKIFERLHTFCMHVMDTAVFASLHSKKGSTCLPGKKIGKYCRVFVSPLPFVLLLFCLFKELGCVCDPLSPWCKKYGFTYILHIRRYGKTCTYCHMLYILLHPWRVVQLDCQCAYVHISFAWCFFFFSPP